MANFSLDPENAALSIAARVETIKKCETYIRETMKRYDGLRALETLLAQQKVAEKVATIITKG